MTKDWHVHAYEGSRDGRWAIYDEDEERIAVCITKEQADALVRDHSSMPDLLAALERIAALERQDWRLNPDDLAVVHAAIAKA